MENNIKIYVTSDLHFGHKNILSHESSRWKLCGITEQSAIVEAMIRDNLSEFTNEFFEKYKKIAQSNYIEKHDQSIINNWNSIVKDDDIIFILGDFSWYNANKTNELLKKLKGKKILIIGDHDSIFLNKNNFDKSLFEEITYYKEIKINNIDFVLSHYPIAEWNGKEHNSIHLFGHLHTIGNDAQFFMSKQKNCYNVGYDIYNRLVNIDEFISRGEKNE